jgi:leucyl aminopeptidase
MELGVTDLAGLAATDDAALPLYAVRPSGLEAFLTERTPTQAGFLRSQNFSAAPKTCLLLPGDAGLAGAVLGLGADTTPFAFGDLANNLPGNTIWAPQPGDYVLDDAALGFLLGAYAYDRLKTPSRIPAKLADSSASPRVRAIAQAVTFARDLINTPPNLLGPAELAIATADLGRSFGAACETITAAALRERFPALAAVGAGSDRPPAAVVLDWTGSQAAPDAPIISLCGKGVCFDTGGYDLKPSAAMLKMKKDMGGAAILLGVAQLVMTFDLPVRLRVRIGCVENSVSGHAMRPSDVLRTHAGLTVEVGNTDAEGRLVLCDLLAEAAAEKPNWLIDAATLTGAARVALGPDLPALFCTDDALAADLLCAGDLVHDPLWRLPLFAGYDSWLDSKTADVNTVSSKPFAGAIIAALFLRRFVPDGIAWAHVDVYAWNDQNRPGRPEGGEAQTLRAIYTAIESMNHDQVRSRRKV